MTIITLDSPLWYPTYPINTAVVTQPAFTIDAVDDRFALICEIPKTGTISKVVWPAKSVASADTIHVRVETVDAGSGDPTGTLINANAKGSEATPTANNQHFTSLDAGVAVTVGDIIAIVIEAQTGYTGDVDIADASALPFVISGFPYIKSENAGGGYGNDVEGGSFALEYDDGTYAYMPLVWPIETASEVVFKSDTSPKEGGVKFTVPFPMRVIGAWGLIENDGGGTVKLYATGEDPAGTTLGSFTIDKDQSGSTANRAYVRRFASAITLVKNTTYRLAVVASSTTQTTLGSYLLGSAAVLDAMPGGSNWSWTQEAAGSWADNAEKWPMMGLLVDGFDDGTGGGSTAFIKRSAGLIGR